MDWIGDVWEPMRNGEVHFWGGERGEGKEGPVRGVCDAAAAVRCLTGARWGKEPAVTGLTKGEMSGTWDLGGWGFTC